jgi:hypothetical protein
MKWQRNILRSHTSLLVTLERLIQKYRAKKKLRNSSLETMFYKQSGWILWNLGRPFWNSDVPTPIGKEARRPLQLLKVWYISKLGLAQLARSQDWFPMMIWTKYPMINRNMKNNFISIITLQERNKILANLLKERA